MKVYIGADHRGFHFKQSILTVLEKLGHKVMDLGTYSDQQPCDYPDVAQEVCENVAKERDARGILVCMSGIGQSIAANKVKGIYAALCYNLEAAELSRKHNNANVLVLSAKFVPEADLPQILDVWMTTPFEGGRHMERVKKIMDMEDRFGGPAAAEPSRPQEQQSSSPASANRPRRSGKPRSFHPNAPAAGQRGPARPSTPNAGQSFRPDGNRSAFRGHGGASSQNRRSDKPGYNPDSLPSYASRKPDARAEKAGRYRSAHAGQPAGQQNPPAAAAPKAPVGNRSRNPGQRRSRPSDKTSGGTANA